MRGNKANPQIYMNKPSDSGEKKSPHQLMSDAAIRYMLNILDLTCGRNE